MKHYVYSQLGAIVRWCYFDMSDGQKSAIGREEFCSQVSCFPKALSLMLCRTITTEYFCHGKCGPKFKMTFF